jgi:hypothetical protein
VTSRQVVLLTCLFVLLAGVPLRARAQTGLDWRSDWSVRRGFTITIDSEGYQLPTSIAFVPRPGPGPKDPLYFVTELRGTVKVITNDRSVLTFAKDFFTLRPAPAFSLANSPEVGLTGICLEPQRGYVFVTFAYHDAGGILRNNIVRFRSRPGTFSLSPLSSVDFRGVFRNDQSTVSHQIGSCQVRNDHLYVGLGDGGQPNRSRALGSTLGKVLRITLDGKPARDNPFFDPARPDHPSGYVWASGFRNPFGMTLVGESLFVVDNGNAIDRFVRVDRGEDYFWAGSDAAIGTKAIAVISPGRGVSSLVYRSRSAGFWSGFFFNVSGSPLFVDRGRPPQVMRVDYSVASQKLLAAPEPFARYRGSTPQVLSALAFGPDGLYVVPLFPNQSGTNPILKIAADSAATYPFALEDDRDAALLFFEKGCTHCHSRGVVDTPNIGPNLATQRLVPRLLERLGSDEYRRAIDPVDARDEEPFRSFRAARREVLAARGLDRVRLWLRYRIQEPRFDRVASAMPNVGVTADEAAALADYLVAGYVTPGRTVRERIARAVTQLLPARVGRRHLLLFFAAGVAAGGAVILLWTGGRARRRGPAGRVPREPKA